MNSSWSERFNGGVQLIPQGVNRKDPHGHGFEIVIILQGRGCQEYQQQARVMGEANQSAQTVKFNQTCRS